MKRIESIIGNESAECLRNEFEDLLCSSPSIFEVDDLLSDYGLEPDYLEDLLCSMF